MWQGRVGRSGRNDCTGERRTGAGGRLSRQPVGAGKGHLLRTPGPGPRAAPASVPPVSEGRCGDLALPFTIVLWRHRVPGERKGGQPRPVSPEATQETSDAERARRGRAVSGKSGCPTADRRPQEAAAHPRRDPLPYLQTELLPQRGGAAPRQPRAPEPRLLRICGLKLEEPRPPDPRGRREEPWPGLSHPRLPTARTP